jgi:hypothetical protein
MAAVSAPAGTPGPAVKPKPNAPTSPDKPATEIPPAPAPNPVRVESQPEAKPKAATAGILAFKDKLASLTQDKVAPRLGAEARHAAADDVSQQPSSRGSMLAANTSGSSGGVNLASLNRSVGGGGGSGGSGAMPGVAVGRATSSIASTAASDRPKPRSGMGSRSDEEIQIVFDRLKATLYRLYSRELRNNPALKGQMVLRLTIEPDGSVSMCALQSSDMNAPELADQVMSRVRSTNFGAKDGAAVTIVYPIEFLPQG